MSNPHKERALAYIRKTYGVPAYDRARVIYKGFSTPKSGVIVGAEGAHLTIRFDGERGETGPFHPTWEMEYPIEEAKP